MPIDHTKLSDSELRARLTIDSSDYHALTEAATRFCTRSRRYSDQMQEAARSHTRAVLSVLDHDMFAMPREELRARVISTLINHFEIIGDADLVLDLKALRLI